MLLQTIFIVFVLAATMLALPLRESSNDLIEGRATGDVKFYLFTNSNPTIPQRLYIGDEDSVKNSYFNSSVHTKIIVHGWQGFNIPTPTRTPDPTSTPAPTPTPTPTFNVGLRQAYLSKDDFNIITIDWTAYSTLNYLSARAKVPVVGEDIAEFVDFLNEKFGLSFDKLVVIGQSLGAHVAGFTGKSVKRGKIAGMVGLDPAYPLYSYANPTTRLASTDAKHVQSIQTNGNLKGFLRPIGTASFYANWGRSQPGCGTDLDGTCAHKRAATYYVEAVRGYSFTPMYECESYDNILDRNGCDMLNNPVEIGDPLEIRPVEGIFYFETNDRAPFGHIGDSVIFL